MVSNLPAKASNLPAIASNRLAVASNLLTKASNLLGMASNRLAMASNLLAIVGGRPSTSDGLQPTSEGLQPTTQKAQMGFPQLCFAISSLLAVDRFVFVEFRFLGAISGGVDLYLLGDGVGNRESNPMFSVFERFLRGS